MKILLGQSTVAIPTHGGENKANRQLLEALASRGNACEIVAPALGAQGPGTPDEFLRALSSRGIALTHRSAGIAAFRAGGVDVHAVLDIPGLRSQFADRIREFAPDVVLVSSQDPGQVLLETAMSVDPARVIYLAHTMLFFPFGPNSFSTTLRGTDLVGRVARVVTVSRYLQNYIQRWANCESTVVPFPAYGPGPFRRLSTFDSGFITMINPCAYKGITIFLELARALPNERFAAVPSWGTTEADRAALDALPNVTLLAPEDDIDRLFEQTRVLIVPSLWGEGFPLVPVEAMLRGIPVIASDSGGLPEAKLGVDYVVPVRPIEGFRESFDDRKLPIPILPAQEIEPWRKALRELTSDRSRYDFVSRMSHEAAESWVSGLSAAPFERLFGEVAATVRSSSRFDEESRENPQVAARLSRLSPERRALLASKLRGNQIGGARMGSLVEPRSDDRIPRRTSSGDAPLSFAQERLWFFDQLDPGAAAYNNFDAFRVIGKLDVDVLERSLSEIVRRHEVLRTTIGVVDAQPVQLVSSGFEVKTRRIDLVAVGATKAFEIGRLASEEARRPFDLARGPLMRVVVMRLAPEEHLLLLTLHHIVFDGWSIEVLFRELEVLYSSSLAGRPSPLPELTIQYGDYAIWQRQWLTGRRREDQVAYWRDHLLGAPAVLDLPTDRPRPAVQRFEGARVARHIPVSLANALREVGRSEQATLFMTLLASYAVLLSRYTEQLDIVIGVPIAGRTRTELESLIGFFANTLPLRLDLSGEPTFRELLRRARRCAVGAFAHQDLPFEKLVEELRPERSLSRGPIFQVAFALQPTAHGHLDLPGARLRREEIHTATAKFDLSLLVAEGPEGLITRFEYDTDLFDAETVHRLMKNFETLLSSIVADSSKRVSELGVMGEVERRRVLVEWNQTATEYPREKTVHALFEEQTERTPEAVAVVFEEERLSYRQLNERANRLARYLARRGVGPEVLVGLCVERSLEMVVGLLAILKVGGAYVPLDPAYPRHRLELMLENTAARVVLTQQTLLGSLPDGSFERVLLDSDWPEIGKESGENLRRHARPSTLVYVLHTSGSTGVPKGVEVRQESLVNYAHFIARDLLGIDPAADTPLAFATVSTISADLGNTSIFASLISGGCLHVVGYETAMDGGLFAGYLSENPIDVLKIVPSHLAALLSSGGGRGVLPRRTLILGGEALSWELVERIQGLRGTCEIVNHYGPTETTVGSLTFRLSSGERRGSSVTVPIGRPIANTEVFILDALKQPAPVGVPGELYIGGTGLAQGYCHQADETEARFVPHPFSESSGARLYRTGDRARYLPDGNVEFLGRADDQIKIRGFRIELGEIETVLSSHPAVHDVVLLAREDGGIDRRLVAYVVKTQGAAVGPSVSELREFLKQRLPDYMVPAAYVFLDSLPLTPNGKVDRRALPAPDQTRPELKDFFVGPRNSVEETVAGIWSGVLGLDRVGVYDNFFELGGHSLLATQVVARLQDAFTVKIPLRNVFEAPTVAELSERLEAEGRAAHVDVSSIAQLTLQVAELSENDVQRMLEERSDRQLKPEASHQ